MKFLDKLKLLFEKYKYSTITKFLFSFFLGVMVLIVSQLKFSNLLGMVCFIWVFILFFIVIPTIYRNKFFSLSSIFKEILIFQLYFLKETYIPNYKGSRKVFFISSFCCGLIPFKIFNNTGIILSLFYFI